jgi:anti-anti-sigma factor
MAPRGSLALLVEVVTVVIAKHVRPDGSFLLVLAGDLDTASADDVRRAGLDLIAEAVADEAVLVDLIDVPFMDSTGIGALIALQNAADEAGLKLVLLDPSKRVTQVLDITHLTDVFTVERSGDWAEAAGGHSSDG